MNNIVDNNFLIKSINNFGIVQVKEFIPNKKNILKIQDYFFEINLKTQNINFIYLSKFFSEQLLIELSNYLNVKIIINGKLLQNNWIILLDIKKIILFLCSKYIDKVSKLNNLIVITYNQDKTHLSNIKPKKIRKKNIPVALKRKVWSRWIGEEIGKTKCFCCKLTEITQLNFSCGHIVAEANGGSLNIENLRPICTSCNSSMGTQNMNDFIKTYGL